MPDQLGLLHDPAYRRFWLGQSISFIGSHVTELALPLTAVVVLDATPDQMGLLTAFEYAPFLLFGLLAGVWVDRVRRRPILIATDLVSGAAIALIPAAALFQVLRIEVLYLVAFLVGVAGRGPRPGRLSGSFLPTLVGRERLIEGNAKLEVSHSVASIVGPGLGGALVQLVTAPITLVIDSLSYVVSAICMVAVRVVEPPPLPRAAEASIRDQIGDGLRVVARTPDPSDARRVRVHPQLLQPDHRRPPVLYAIDFVGLGRPRSASTLAAGGRRVRSRAVVVEHAGAGSGSGG